MIRFWFWFLFLCAVLGLAPVSVAYAGGDEECTVPCPTMDSGELSRVVQLESELQRIRARLGKPGWTSGQLAEIRKLIAELTARIDELEARANAADQRLDGHDAAIAALRDQINFVEEMVLVHERRITGLEHQVNDHEERLDVLEQREKYLPVGFVGAGGLTFRAPMTTGDGTPLTGPMLGFGGAGLRFRYDPREAGGSYVGALGLGFYEFQKSAGFLAAGELGFHPGKHVELGLLAGAQGHFIQALDPRLTGHTAYSMGAVVGPHLGFGLGDGWGNISIDVPVMFGQAKSATSSSRLWIEAAPMGTFTFFIPNPKFKKKIEVTEASETSTTTEATTTVTVEKLEE